MSALASPLKSRFCPSPTGLMHLGNARTALFSYLLAYSSFFKQQSDNSVFLLRIEDTDRARSTPAFSDQLMEDLKWLGLSWNEGAYYQSERTALYEDYYQKLLEQKKAYYCFCTETELQLTRRRLMQTGQAPRYAGTCRHLSVEQIQAKFEKGLKPAIRYRIGDNQTIEFMDVIQGPKSFQAHDIGDFIIKKNDDSASFMFCNALDDSLMGVTHVLRGEDHLTNTPRQLLILQSLGLRAPEYGHMALIVGDDGKPLSKRNGSLSIGELKEQGFLPIAVLNYLSRLGHRYETIDFPDAEKLLPLCSLADYFILKHVSRSPARFDVAQLLHWQKEAISHMSDEAVSEWMSSCAAHDLAFVKTIRDNISQYKDVEFWAQQLLAYELDYQKGDDKHYLIEAGRTYFETAKALVIAHGLDKKALFEGLKQELSIKGPALFMPMRVAMTGVGFGPEMDKIFSLLGPEKLLKRLNNVLAFIGKENLETV